MIREPIDIIIVTWNACDYTRYCLDSIRSHTDYPYNLIVVDNGSIDGTIDYLERQDDVLLIQNRENLGYGGAITRGYEVGDSHLTCVMNNDIVVSPGWLEPMVRIMRQDREIGILGTLRPASFCLHPDGQRDTGLVLRETRGYKLPDPEVWLEQFCSPYTYEDFVEEAKRINNFGLREIEGPPSFISTCCVLVNREIIDRIGGLADPRFFRYGCEDVDLSWRISIEGYKIALTSEAYVHHFKHVSVEVSDLDRKASTEGNMRIFYEKWRNEINRFLTAKLSEGVDVKKRLGEEDPDYWFLARLEGMIGAEKFWQSVERVKSGKERI
ncbi:MAG: N-acetylglucosaminyl-diphospho-decaprenol L-rhamnosyltransferase [Microgenomates group bacterium ADurb.Bin219]|nr:MAG: N-acetylglucosaminyl-diphospho-decaprenol L-rhamnosyltransferase [Microgenomates group bacterium ADurb.Bin219]